MAEVHSKVNLCLEHLNSQTTFLARLRSARGHLAEPALHFRLNGATIAATPDLVFLCADGRATVVDWKVSKSETNDYSHQLQVYALAVARCGRWPAIRPEAIELWEVNLLKNEVHHHPITIGRLDEAEDFVYASLMELEALVRDGEYKNLDLSEFGVAERPQSCRHCNFRLLCVRNIEAEGRPTKGMEAQGRLW